MKRRSSMRQAWLAGVATCLAVATIQPHDSAAQVRPAPIPHNSGQSISPSFEGWFENPDGTFSLSFGYMNRNRQEELHIPIGPLNRFEPGPADQGQPTYFLTRRQTGVFVVVVPRDFGNQKLTWTVTAHGQTISIPGHLRPEWKIDALKEVTTGNTPPVIKFDPSGPPGQGPAGASTALRATVAEPLTLSAWVTDDMVRDRPETEDRPERAPALGVLWSKYRGPGRVTFREAMPTIDATGKVVTTATFSEPGEYVLRLLAWEGTGPPMARGVMATGFQCCWTNGYLKVTVTTQRSGS